MEEKRKRVVQVVNEQRPRAMRPCLLLSVSRAQPKTNETEFFSLSTREFHVSNPFLRAMPSAPTHGHQISSFNVVQAWPRLLGLDVPFTLYRDHNPSVPAETATLSALSTSMPSRR